MKPFETFPLYDVVTLYTTFGAQNMIALPLHHCITKSAPSTDSVMWLCSGRALLCTGLRLAGGCSHNLSPCAVLYGMMWLCSGRTLLCTGLRLACRCSHNLSLCTALYGLMWLFASKALLCTGLRLAGGCSHNLSQSLIMHPP